MRVASRVAERGLCNARRTDRQVHIHKDHLTESELANVANRASTIHSEDPQGSFEHFTY
jgi:hypothetical protein